MVKKFILMVCFVLLLTSLAYADSINVTIQCTGGGQTAYTGNFEPATGVFNITAVISDCAENDGSKNGTVTSNGTIGPGSAINMTTLYAVTSMDLLTNDTLSFNCSQFINGTYDFPTTEFNGSITSGCNGSGNLHVPLEDLLSTLLILL